MASLLNITFTPTLFSHPQFHSQFHGLRLPHYSSTSFPLLSHSKTQLSHKFKAPQISCCFSLINSISDDNNTVFIVVNFYHFVFIQNPQLEVSNHLSFLEELDIHGRIYINEQGINAQFSGPSKDATSYVNWLRDDQRFTNILVQISPSSSGHAFPKLKLRYKPTLVQFDLGVQDLPLLDPSMRAEPLSPAEWRARLTSPDRNNDTKDEDQKSFILLDVRNGYEWDIGHFHGAERPEVDCFRTTSFGLSDLQALQISGEGMYLMRHRCQSGKGLSVDLE